MSTVQFDNAQSIIAAVSEVCHAVALSEEGLLRRGRVERTFTAALANAINRMVNIPGVKADPLYNKHLDATKRLAGHLIELDVAVHTQGTDESNVLAIELETTNSPKRDDVWKLTELTNPLGGYGYKLGLFVVFGIKAQAGRVLAEEWYQNGRRFQP